MVVLSAPARSHQLRWDTEVCILQASSRAELVASASDLAGSLDTAGSVDLKDLAFTLNTAPPLANASRLSLVAATVAELRARLGDALPKLADPGCRRIRDARGIYFFAEPVARQGKVAFLFPGEGAQYPNMLADVCLHFPDARAWFDLMDRAFFDHPRGYLPSELAFPPGRQDNHEQDNHEGARLWNMDGAVETVFAANQALFTLLNRLGVRADMIAGHSSGDYSALLAAGRIAVAGDENLIQHIRALNAVYEDFASSGRIPKASLLAVGSANTEVVRRMLDEHADELVVALDNCPQQIVLCGTEAAIDQAERVLRDQGAVTERLPFGRPYHTPLFSSFSDPLRAFFDGLNLSTPSADIYSCASASLYPSDAIEFRNLAVEQWTRPVRFRETIEAMYEAGARIFVEVGPRGNLTGFVENTLRGRPAVAVATNTLQRTGLAQLNHAVGLLAAQGVPVQAAYLYARRAPRRADLNGASEQTSSSGSVQLSLRLPSLRLTSTDVPAAAGPAVAAAPAFETHPALAAVTHDARARAMQEYFKSMEKFLQVEEEVMQAALASGRARATEAGAEGSARNVGAWALASRGKLPFIDRVVSLDPGRAAIAICDLNLDEHRFLRDHTLGATVSNFDADLIGLPVLPLAVSIEMLAEVGSLVCPGLLAVGARHIRAHRWVAIESERLTLRLTAVAGDSPGEVRVEMHEGETASSGAGGERAPLAEATMIFAVRFPPAEQATEFRLRDDRPSKWPAGEMYGRTGMFHGPAFQLVERMDRSGEDGAEATLVGRTSEDWMRTNAAPAFLLDPMVLDAMGQIVGYWVGDRFQAGLSVFPIKLDRLEVFTRALAPAERARCRVRVTHFDDDWIRSDIDTVGEDGTVMIRMHQWEDRRLDLPARLYDFRIAPGEVLLSDEWLGAFAQLPDTGASRACRLRLPRGVLEAHGGIWLRVVAHLVLGREERSEWQRLSTAPMNRRLDWLAGRIAAKDAVRLLLNPRVGLLRPGDIQIYADPKGRPLVRGPWVQFGGHPPHVTIAHSGGEALAIAIDAESCSGIGVDIEQVGRTGAVVCQAALTDRERDWLAAIEETQRPEWATRFWCAKEAASKALGCGLSNGGQELEVRDIDRDGGVLTLVPGSLLVNEPADSKGPRILVCTKSNGRVVTAAAVV